jgi:transcription antitermination factor NusG
MDLQQRVPLLDTAGVASILGVGRYPVPVRDSEIAAIDRIVASGLPLAPWPFLKAGQVVHIKHGPLTGLEGIVVTVKNQSRLVVSVEMLQRSLTVEIECDWAEPVKREYGDTRVYTAA